MHITNLSNVLFFSEKNKVFKKKNKTFSLKEQELFKNLTCCFFHNGIYMPKLLIFPSDLSATPQTPCPPTFRLKDIHRENVSAEKISFRKNDSLKIRETPIRLKDSNPRLKHSRTQSFSRNAHEQGVCGKSEGFEGFFRVSFIEHDL